MTVEQNKEVVARFYDEVLNTWDVGVLSELAVPDYEEHDPLPGQGTGLEGLTERVNILRSGMDVRFTVEDLIAEGDRVAVRWTNDGTHVGEFLGIPPTGKHFSTTGVDIYRMQGGRMAEHWHVVDMYTQLIQLGVIPAPGGEGS